MHGSPLRSCGFLKARRLAPSSARMGLARPQISEGGTLVMNRTAFLAVSAAFAATAEAAAQDQTRSIPGGTHFVERKEDFDADSFAKIVGRDAQIRQLYEAVSFKPTLLNNVKNSFNGLQF